MIGLFAFTGAWSGLSFIHESVEITGRVAIMVCIAGRCWSTLYIDGKKGHQLVDRGPYSISRNPLYVFSVIGAAGFGAQTGSLSVALIGGFLTWLVLRLTISGEESFLRERLGAPYLAYSERTPRFWPDPRLWRGQDVVEVRPKLLVTTFMDSLIFLLAIPFAEGFEALQGYGWLPTLFTLP